MEMSPDDICLFKLFDFSSQPAQVEAKDVTTEFGSGRSLLDGRQICQRKLAPFQTPLRSLALKSPEA